MVLHTKFNFFVWTMDSGVSIFLCVIRCVKVGYSLYKLSCCFCPIVLLLNTFGPLVRWHHSFIFGGYAWIFSSHTFLLHIQTLSSSKAAQSSYWSNYNWKFLAEITSGARLLWWLLLIYRSFHYFKNFQVFFIDDVSGALWLQQRSFNAAYLRRQMI